ncbi:MAG: PEP-CTERM sorting domain-containing protein [Rubrivivax sp.]|nr:MAG: PEP-CTERM sorting domain-containing protein [Rubrivivax sp.]
MKMNSVTVVKNKVMKRGKQLAAIAATGLALATASLPSHALEVSGTLDPLVGVFGLDELALAFTPGTYAFTVVGPVTFSLYTPSYTPVAFTSSSGFGLVSTYTFASLSGSYIVDLFGLSGASYKVGILGTGTVSSVPEPESLVMALAGLGVLVFVSRRRSLDV